MSREDLNSQQFDLRPTGEDATADALREAVGAGPDDHVTIRTPQFSRPAGWPEPGGPPSTPEQWEALRDMPMGALCEMGCGNWDGLVAMFPHEWYARVPEGFQVTDIFHNDEPFQRGVTDDDMRYGCLSFGVRAKGGKAIDDEATASASKRADPCIGCEGERFEGFICERCGATADGRGGVVEVARLFIGAEVGAADDHDRRGVIVDSHPTQGWKVYWTWVEDAEWHKAADLWLRGEPSQA
jgi:hypothetical protein